MRYEKILVPLDGSILAEMALEHLHKFASQGAQIHLLSVVTANAYETVGMTMPLTSLPPDITEEIEIRKAYLKKIAASLEEQGYQVVIDVRPGMVLETIAEVANMDIDLVVIASHHRTGLNKFIFGSVAERLIQETHCPIVIV